MSAPDRYEIQAQYTPAVLCSAPFIFFGIYYLAKIDLSVGPKILAVGFGSVTMSLALYQLWAHSCQILGKKLESYIFKDGLNYPTTEYLLDSNGKFSPEYKKIIIDKINADFKISLRGKTSDSENNRRRINEAVGQVRRTLWKKNPMVLQRNIQFGFAKNIAGGSIVAAIASLLLLIVGVVSHNRVDLEFSSLFLVVYLLSSIFFIFAIKFRAKYYASTLFDEYLGSK